MPQENTHGEEVYRTPSRNWTRRVLAVAVLVVPIAAYTSLLAATSTTPLVYVTDHCPQSDMTCGSMMMSGELDTYLLLLPALGLMALLVGLMEVHRRYANDV